MEEMNVKLMILSQVLNVHIIKKQDNPCKTSCGQSYQQNIEYECINRDAENCNSVDIPKVNIETCTRTQCTEDQPCQSPADCAVGTCYQNECKIPVNCELKSKSDLIKESISKCPTINKNDKNTNPIIKVEKGIKTPSDNGGTECPRKFQEIDLKCPFWRKIEPTNQPTKCGIHTEQYNFVCDKGDFSEYKCDNKKIPSEEKVIQNQKCNEGKECDDINDCQSGLICHKKECHLPKWEEKWNDCVGKCGFGTKTSYYTCDTGDDSHCQIDNKPSDETKECDTGIQCNNGVECKDEKDCQSGSVCMIEPTSNLKDKKTCGVPVNCEVSNFEDDKKNALKNVDDYQLEIALKK